MKHQSQTAYPFLNIGDESNADGYSIYENELLKVNLHTFLSSCKILFMQKF